MIDQYPSANGVLTSLIWRKTAAGGETSLSGYDNASQSLSYTPGQEQVYLNGILLVRGDDYTATNGTSITGLTALAANDFVQINCYNNFSVATVPTTSLTGTITNSQLAGSISNDKLSNSSITINGSPVSLGGSVSLAGDIESVTAGTGLTGGGTSGSVTLSLNTSAVIQPTIVDAKGDIIAATAADTVARLAVGANDTVLTADSSTATGLKWATVSSAAPFLVQKVTGRFYGMSPSAPVQSQPTLNTTYFIPVYLAAATYDRLRITSGDAHMGTNTVRLGIYNADATTGLPTTVVLNAGTVSTTAANTDYDITINQTITAGYYYLAFNAQSSSENMHYFAVYTSSGINFGNSEIPATFSNTGVLTSTNSLHIPRVASVTGAFGTVSSISSYGGNAPVVMIRMA